MKYAEDFEKTFILAMKFEVGAHFDPNDPDTQEGLIDTPEQRRKCGYVNHPADPGGETKFGIAQRANPDVNIKKLSLAHAKEIYHEKYWLAFNCNTMPHLMNTLFFDAAINVGFKRATRFLQTAMGITADGAYGPNTAKNVSLIEDEDDVRHTGEKFLNAREQFYRNLAARRPKMAVFLKGWLNRVHDIREWFDNN